MPSPYNSEGARLAGSLLPSRCTAIRPTPLAAKALGPPSLPACQRLLHPHRATRTGGHTLGGSRAAWPPNDAVWRPAYHLARRAPNARSASRDNAGHCQASAAGSVSTLRRRKGCDSYAVRLWRVRCSMVCALMRQRTGSEPEWLKRTGVGSDRRAGARILCGLNGRPPLHSARTVRCGRPPREHGQGHP